MAAASSSHLPLLLFALLLSTPILADKGTCDCTDAGKAVKVTLKNGTPADACTAAIAQCRMTDNCAAGCKCDTKKSCPMNNLQGKMEGTDAVCTGTCGADSFGCTKKPGGEDDPHVTGFDHSRFDFHGIHGHNYVFFGRQDGDMLVTRMRESGRSIRSDGVVKTYFDGFGLQVAGSSRRIGLALVKNSAARKARWVPEVRVDDIRLTKDFEEGDLSVKFEREQRTVLIETAETSFGFHTKHLMNSFRHWNVYVSVLKPVVGGRYLGVLGVTLNRKLGIQVHADLDVVERRGIKMETAMRRRFEVGSLFPDGFGDVDVLSGVVRTVTRLHRVTGRELVKLEAKALS